MKKLITFLIVAEKYDIKKIMTFNGSKGNFRKILNSEYKANRKKQDLPPLLHDMHEYVKKITAVFMVMVLKQTIWLQGIGKICQMK